MRVGDAMDEGGNEGTTGLQTSINSQDQLDFSTRFPSDIYSVTSAIRIDPSWIRLEDHALVDLGLVGLEFTIDHD
jgi:hypothetical protein